MVNNRPVKSPTITESASPRAKGTFWVHGSLVLVTLLVALPSPAAALWGGRREGSPWLALSAAAVWVLFSLLFRGLARGAQGEERRQETWSALLLMADVAGLTVLLSVGGAAQNPFTMLYFVPITQATLVARRWTSRVAALSVAGFSVLLLQTARALSPHLAHPHHAHFFDHVQGMAIALAVAGLFITVFVREIAFELARRQEAIDCLSRQQAQDRVAVALGALSAGAGHELGSPLGTVQLLAEELPHLNGEERDAAIRTIVQEVQRMKGIVHSMLTTELSAEALKGGRSWALDELAWELSEDEVSLEIDCPFSTRQPRSVLEQILRELVRNARESGKGVVVRVGLFTTEDALTIVVEDDGPGLDPEALKRATEPFVSSKGSTGLGLFLVSVHAQQLGGRLVLGSEQGKGTRAQLTLPLAPKVGSAKAGET
jgi:two-component system sensor histidine kinase RegB